MKTVYQLVLFCWIAGLASCVNVQSNSKPDAVPSFRRVLIVTKVQDRPKNYVQQLAGMFPAGYEVCTLALSPLSFDNPDEAIQKQLKECQSEVILTLELNQAGSARRYGRRAYSTPFQYYAEMKSVATGKPFWKAIISGDPYYTGNSTPSPRPIIKRLIADHIIEGKMSTGGAWQASN